MNSNRTPLAILMLCLCGHIAAETFVLRPAQAQYSVSLSGVPTGMDARIDLKEPSPSRFHIVFSVDHPLIKHQEESIFQWQPSCHARPFGYSFNSKGFGIKRGGNVDFDWQALQASGSDSEYAITDEMVDALGLAMVARCDLSVGNETLAYAVAEPDGVTDFNYKIVKRELLKTPAGTFNTIKLERIYPERGRRTFLWAAEELDYFMVRMDHIENPLVRGKMELRSFEWATPPGESLDASPHIKEDDNSHDAASSHKTSAVR